MEVLADLFQTAQVEDEQLLVYYAYQSERDAIIYNFPEAVDIRVPGALELWNEHKAPILLAHPASAGHGLNLQHGGRTIVWYNMTYDLELYQQANKRLHRMGQDKPVRLYHLLTNGIDSHVYNSVLTGKAALASVVMEELKYSTN
jgi:hypothetical protein